MTRKVVATRLKQPPFTNAMRLPCFDSTALALAVSRLHSSYFAQVAAHWTILTSFVDFLSVIMNND